MRDRLVGVVDTTTRDGNQSLWSATGLTTPDVLAIAPTMDRVGYRGARLHLEHAHGGVGPLPPRGPLGAHPAVSAAMPNTPLSIITTGHALHLLGSRPTRT